MREGEMIEISSVGDNSALSGRSGRSAKIFVNVYK